MWDPISVFAICWALNVDLPNGRLNLSDVIEAKETVIIVEKISQDITLRSGF